MCVFPWFGVLERERERERERKRIARVTVSVNSDVHFIPGKCIHLCLRIILFRAEYLKN